MPKSIDDSTTKVEYYCIAYMTRHKISHFLTQINIIMNSLEIIRVPLNYLPGCIPSPYFFSCNRLEKSWVREF